MKEFYGTTGGRTALNEDFEALRDLALAFHHIFDSCDTNFIISGCEWKTMKYPGDNKFSIKVLNGYVWLDGKIRKVNATTIRNSNVAYIVANDSSGQQINYATRGVFGEMSYDYGASVVQAKQSGASYIKVETYKSLPNISNVLFNKFVITKTADEEQETNDNVDFKNGLGCVRLTMPSDNFFVDFRCSESNLNIYIRNTYGQMMRSFSISDHIESSNEVLNNKDLELSCDKENGLTGHFYEIDGNNTSYETTDCHDPYIDNIGFDSIYYKKKPFNGWTAFIWTDKNGAKTGDITSLMIKEINHEYYIAGLLPINDSNFSVTKISYDDDSKYADFKTNIKLPFELNSTEGTINSFDGDWVVRGENITIKNTCTIWYIKDGFLCYKAYNDTSIGIGLPCPNQIFWNFITD